MVSRRGLPRTCKAWRLRGRVLHRFFEIAPDVDRTGRDALAHDSLEPVLLNVKSLMHWRLADPGPGLGVRTMLRSIKESGHTIASIKRSGLAW